MLNLFAQLNWLAIAAASVLSFLLGGAWFAGFFRKAYAVALGREGLPAQKMAPLFLAGPFLCGVVTTVTSALLMKMLGVATLAGALQFGALVGCGISRPPR